MHTRFTSTFSGGSETSGSARPSMGLKNLKGPQVNHPNVEEYTLFTPSKSFQMHPSIQARIQTSQTVRSATSTHSSAKTDPESRAVRVCRTHWSLSTSQTLAQKPWASRRHVRPQTRDQRSARATRSGERRRGTRDVRRSFRESGAVYGGNGFSAWIGRSLHHGSDGECVHGWMGGWVDDGECVGGCFLVQRSIGQTLASSKRISSLFHESVYPSVHNGLEHFVQDSIRKEKCSCRGKNSSDVPRT